ncbi:MAG: SIMPL domain-containing protein [Sulfuricurvum sp.]|nr:SIMPL domain-containing protein [Sulfuricurvum sp.]
MQKYIASILLPILASAQMNITSVERVATNVKPDVLRGSLNFEEQSKNANTIKEHLNAIVAEVKRADPKGEVCRGGGYNLSPRYNYKDQKQEFIGYSGNLSFGCEFVSIEQYNALSASIDKVTASSVRKSQGELALGVSVQSERETQNRLRLELLRKAGVQASSFAKETGMRCEIASVNFGGTSQVQPMMMKAMAMADSVSTESPIQSDSESSLEATVDYRCSKSEK